MKQLVLNWPIRNDTSAASFWPTAGSLAARNALNALTPTHTPGKLAGLVLVGGPGSGKTHLAAMWKTQNATNPLATVVDDVVTLTPPQQEALFHTFNNLTEHGGALLITIQQPVQSLHLLADVHSRLLTLNHVYLNPPDEAELAQLVVKLAADRQINLAPAVVTYLITRAERSVGALRQVMEALDSLSLEEKRAITVPLARRVLENTSPNPAP